MTVADVLTAGPVLAIESSTRSPSVALERSDGRRFALALTAQGFQASDLAPAIRDLLRRAELAPAELTRILVGIGPGSLTGLRVGSATAIGLARVIGAQLVGVPSIANWAFHARGSGARGPLLCVHDLRGGHVAVAGFEVTESDGLPLRELSLPGGEETMRPVPYAELPALLPTVQDHALCAEPELLSRLACAESDVQRAFVPGTPSAVGLLRVRCLGRPDDVQPLYLRAFGS